jgi:hypothetical protein
MNVPQPTIDPKIRFLISIPDGKPEEATPFQGFAFSLCQSSGLLRFMQQMPTDIFELTPDVLPYRIARRIANEAPINWYGQSPRALRSHPFPVEAAFTVVLLDRNEKIAEYVDWMTSCPGPVTLVADDPAAHIQYSALTPESLRRRFLAVCADLRGLGTVSGVEQAEAAISSWVEPEARKLPFEIGGHGTIFPNAAALGVCGFKDIGVEPFKRHGEGEAAHLEQIILTANAIFDERDANPPSVANLIYPRTPDLNLYCPATYELKSAFSWRPELARKVRHSFATTLRIIEKQSGYSFEISSEAQRVALLGITDDALKNGEMPAPNPIMSIRQREVWLGTEAVGCLAASEIGAVVRLPNRMNRTRGVVRQFAQHYRSDRPEKLKRSELFRGLQRAISDGFPVELRPLIERSKDGIRIIADAHIEWLDVRGIPLGLRYNVSRIPVTPGNAFIDALSSQVPIQATPEDFRDILIVSGLPEGDIIAEQFRVAFEIFGKEWRDQIRIKWVRVTCRQELIDAINSFQGMMMLFDGHGSHKPDQPGVLWLGDEAVDVWSLRGEVHRAPPIVVLSACDTHAADRNHATVANGFLAMGCRSVLGSVFPLHASYAAMFAARLIYRVSHYVPAAIGLYKRSLTWLEIVSGMLRRQATTDIVRHLEMTGQLNQSLDLHNELHGIVDLNLDDPFHHLRIALLEKGIPEDRLDHEIHIAISSSSTISYLHLGRPETVYVNTPANLAKIAELADSASGDVP